jgi:hypothetical protein
MTNLKSQSEKLSTHGAGKEDKSTTRARPAADKVRIPFACAQTAERTASLVFLPMSSFPSAFVVQRDAQTNNKLRAVCRDSQYCIFFLNYYR